MEESIKEEEEEEEEGGGGGGRTKKSHKNLRSAKVGSQVVKNMC